MHAVQHDMVCHHCGSLCGKNAPTMDGYQFCCQGCASVYEIVSHTDSCEYYTISPHSGVRPKNSDLERFVVLDSALEHARFIEFEDEHIVRASFVLPDMHCGSCVWILERLSRFDQGITTSRVDLLQRRVTIECDKEKTTLSNVARLLTSLGYEPQISELTQDPSRPSSQQHRELYTRIGVAGFGAGNVMMISLANYIAGPGGIDPTIKLLFDILSIGISIPVLLYCAQPWLGSAFQSLRSGIVNLDVPVALGIVTIFIRSCIEIVSGTSEGFLDSFNGLVFFLLIGKLFQQRAFASIDFNRSVRSFFPISAVKVEQGTEKVVHIDALSVQDVVLVRNGEVIPADSILLREHGVVDYSFVTGESSPTECKPGTMLYAGGRVLGKSITCTVVKPASASYMASLWARADVHTERDAYAHQSHRFGLIFTVATLSLATLGSLLWLPDLTMAGNVFTSVLIIACPCALTLSAPISYGTVMGLLGRVGIYLRNTEVVSQLQSIDHIVFDKTGTLTLPLRLSYCGSELTQDLEQCIAAVAAQSTHPISRELARTALPYLPQVDSFEETVGEGISGFCMGYHIRLHGASGETDKSAQTRTFVSINGNLVGYYAFEHVLRSDVPEMISKLRKRYGVSLVTGDSSRISPMLSILFPPYSVNQGARPADKVNYVQQLQEQQHKVMMVGDGVNDVAALSTANVSASVSNSTARIVPACDIIIDANRLHRMPEILEYSRRAKYVVMCAFWFTMAYNVLGMGLSMQGRLSPVITAVLMPTSSLIVIAISVFGAKLSFRRLQWG